jgi:membrane fusion protein (multidrug efflux system)
MKTVDNKNSQNAHVSTAAAPPPAEKVVTPAPAAPPQPPVATPPGHRVRKGLLWAGVVVALAVGIYYLIPWVETELNTVSTDDAYVNGHVTLVAPRVTGQVKKVLVDDNEHVKKGDLLVQLDKEPFAVQVALKRAAVRLAQKNLVSAEAQARALEAKLGSQRWKLQNASEQVNTQIANLRAAIATLNSSKAKLQLVMADFRRGEELVPSGGISKEDLDHRRQSVKVEQASVDQALQQIYAIRVGLGLCPPSLPRGTT